MLQRYKLRLGDGTVLLVDHDGLSTWRVDGRATVQAEGSRTWQPLKEFLAREGAAARRESRPRAPASEALPLVPPPAPREDGLPLVPPPPPREDGLPLVPPPPPREDGLPLVPPPPAREEYARGDALRAAALPPTREDAASLIPPPAAGDDPLLPVPRPAPPEDGLPLIPPPPPKGGAASEEPVPLITALSLEDEPPPALVTSPWNEPTARVTAGEPRRVSTPAAEAAPAGSDRGGHPALEAGGALDPPSLPASPPVQALAEEPVVPDWGDSRGPTPIDELPVIPLRPLAGDPPGLPVGEDHPVPRGHGAPAAARTREDGLSIVPRRPPPGRRDARMPVGGGEGSGPRDGFTPIGERILSDDRAVAALQVVAVFGAFLSRCLAPVNRLERGLPLFPVDEPSSRRSPAPSARAVHARAEVEAGSEPLSSRASDAGGPLVAGEAPLLARGAEWSRELFTKATIWFDGLSARLARLARRDDRGVSAALDEPAAPYAATTHAKEPHLATPTPPEPLPPPPGLGELPVLRLAAIAEAPEEEDVYEGHEGVSVIPAIWLWTKRAVWATALVVGGVFAAQTWEVWFPVAARLGQITFAEVDRHARSSGLTAEQEEALEEVVGQLPHLTPETVRLILSRSPTGILDAPDAFEFACEATDRGLAALTLGEAEELKALREQLLGTLRSAERDRIREYDLARARGVVFPLDSRQALLLYARGARELPSTSRERLQLLLGKAIAAGLARPIAVNADPAPGR